MQQRSLPFQVTGTQTEINGLHCTGASLMDVHFAHNPHLARLRGDSPYIGSRGLHVGQHDVPRLDYFCLDIPQGAFGRITIKRRWRFIGAWGGHKASYHGH
jgi:hypothetical protein